MLRHYVSDGSNKIICRNYLSTKKRGGLYMSKLLRKIIDKMIDLTSIVEVDENGVEQKKPWTWEEFITVHIAMVIGVIIGAILF